MTNKFFLVSILIVLSICSAYANDIIEANEKFTYKGKPIHPGLVKEFSSWISDKGLPTTIAVDISASHSNEYNDSDVEVAANGAVYLKEEGTFEYFYYEWLGKLDNGLHVLMTGDGGGGSGVFGEIFFVKLDASTGFTPEGNLYDRILMSIVRKHNRGDRYDGEIQVLPDQNKVILGKSKYRDEPITLEFK